MSEFQYDKDGHIILSEHQYVDHFNKYVSYVLDYSFCFKDTPEGWNYWCEVYFHLGLTKLMEYA